MGNWSCSRVINPQQAYTYSLCQCNSLFNYSSYSLSSYSSEQFSHSPSSSKSSPHTSHTSFLSSFSGGIVLTPRTTFLIAHFNVLVYFALVNTSFMLLTILHTNHPNLTGKVVFFSNFNFSNITKSNNWRIF